MNITFESKTHAKCADFLKLLFEGREYTLDEFSAAFKKKNFDLEQLLPQCEIIYRSHKMSYNEYVVELRNELAQLGKFTRYREEIAPIEVSLSIGDYDYYKAAKFVGKAESCISTARYYYYQSANILDYDCRVNWKAGYNGIYALRTMNFETAIVWYNNCFDYIIQIAFLAFGLYKGIKKYSSDLPFEEVLKLCTYNSLKTLHENKPDNEGLSQLWDIIETCRADRQDLNDWANYAKHKGGLGYVGLKPESPVLVYMAEPGGKPECRTSEFDTITLDIDECKENVIAAHNALIKCLNDLLDFIDFPQGQLTLNAENKIVLPDPAKYHKVLL